MCACDGLFPLPADEMAIVELDETELFMDSVMLAMVFSSYLPRKRRSFKFEDPEMFMDWPWACDGLSSLPVGRRQTLSWTKLS